MKEDLLKLKSSFDTKKRYSQYARKLFGPSRRCENVDSVDNVDNISVERYLCRKHAVSGDKK